jgi:ATP-binding cassette subfamily B protein
MRLKRFNAYRQLNAMDCGPTCLRMIANYYGRHFSAETIRRASGFNKQGVSMLGISEVAEKMGFRTRGVRIDLKALINDARLPCILHWNRRHFVVLLSAPKWGRSKGLKVADPAQGIVSYTLKEFRDHWISAIDEEGEPVGTALLLEPTAKFYEHESEKDSRLDWGLVLRYFQQSRWKIVQVIIALIITSLLQLVFPFLTQNIVDTGINTRNLQYVTIVLIAQLTLIFSRTIVDFIRSRLLLGISIVVNMSILSDFWMKLTSLPLSYFDSHHTGDTLQRINDNRQIQSFLTGSALNTAFSLFNFLVFSIVMLSYNTQLFFIFFIGSSLYFLWILLFLKIRRKINYQTFHISARENNATLQLVQGMQEIRLNNAEQLKRWEWENIQVGIFKLNFRNLTYNQFQQAGALLINQGKDVVITFIVAKLVMDGQMTFGAMLAVQYILGQLNSPVEQIVGFIQNGQDAKISMERLNEIHSLRDEEDNDTAYITQLPSSAGIRLNNLSFTYPGSGNEPVLRDINLHIPEGKITAIVGASGSGKTTLLKLLLKFYEYSKGEIYIGDSNFRYISPSFWRMQCGTVFQDGFIFNDTVARNIAVSDETPDHQRLIDCCRIANILSFIESLPNGFYSKLGSEGVGVSQGQKQRILIARAIYKNPRYLFFDEATNSLDANNERAIVENLQHYFKNRTVVVVAHRLSTVKNADKIVVLHKGRIEEEGSHQDLCASGGLYFQLVRNQLELGS